MQELSKRIYQQIDGLFAGLQKIEAFTKIDLTHRGMPMINLIVFESTPEKINFILSCYEFVSGRTIAHPCFQITADPTQQTANVVGRYDNAHEALHDEPYEVTQSRNNQLLYTLLHDANPSEEVCSGQYCLPPLYD